MVSIRLQQACGKYAGIIKRMGRGMDYEALEDLENERVKWHNVVMSTFNDEGIAYADRDEATDIALQIATGRYP